MCATSYGRAFLAVSLALLAACGPTGGDVVSTETVLTQTAQSEHFVFHYAVGDGVDVPHVEAFYAWISQRLSVELAAPIHYFKFVDRQQKLALTGYDGNGIAFPDLDIVCTIWPWDNHEITHIVAQRLGDPPALFGEGIAVANSVDPLDGAFEPHWQRVPVHRFAKDLLVAGKLPALAGIVETIAFRQADPDMTYPAAGSFVAYLIEQFGIPKVIALLRGSSPQDPSAVTCARFEQALGLTLEVAEQDWLAFLQLAGDGD